MKTSTYFNKQVHKSMKETPENIDLNRNTFKPLTGTQQFSVSRHTYSEDRRRHRTRVGPPEKTMLNHVGRTPDLFSPENISKVYFYMKWTLIIILWQTTRYKKMFHSDLGVKPDNRVLTLIVKLGFWYLRTHLTPNTVTWRYGKVVKNTWNKKVSTYIYNGGDVDEFVIK